MKCGKKNQDFKGDITFDNDHDDPPQPNACVFVYAYADFDV